MAEATAQKQANERHQVEWTTTPELRSQAKKEKEETVEETEERIKSFDPKARPHNQGAREKEMREE